jgi:hypothetical protein
VHLAGVHCLTQQLARHVGAQHAEAEMQLILAGNVAHHGQRRVDMRSRAGRPGGADHQRDVVLPRRQDHLAQVTPRRCRRRRHPAGAEIVRADIDRAHVAADHVGLSRQPGLERRRRHAVAELARGTEHAQRIAAGATKSIYDTKRCAHSSTPRSGPCCCAP